MSVALAGLSTTAARRGWLGALALVGGAIFVVGILALHLLDRELDPVTELISAYGAGPHWYVLTVSFFAWSVGYLALSVGLGKTVAPARGSTAARMLLFVAASAMFANGIIPCDPGCSNTTFLGALHSVLSFPFFLGTIAAMLLLIGPFGADPRWRTMRRITIALAVYATITMLMLFAWRASGIASWGLVQRLNVLGLVTWYLLTADHLRSVLAQRRA